MIIAKKGAIASVLFALIAAILVAAVPSKAYASSDYDSLIQTSPNLYVYTDGSAKTQELDISTTWWTEFKEAYAKRVQQNIGWPSNFVSEFQYILDNGGSWGVYTIEDTYGVTITLIGTRDPNATCEFSGPATGGELLCSRSAGYGYVKAEYFTHNSYGGNGCGPWWVPPRCSGLGLAQYSSPTVSTDISGGAFEAIANSWLPSYKFFVMNFDMNYPTGYSGATIPRAYTAKYVALGDSYSSGEGNEPFSPDTSIDGTNECHRSEFAYPSLLFSEIQDTNIDSFVNAACSGATTNDVLGVQESDKAGSWNEQPQISLLSDETQIVTVTIGGNDVGFKEFAEQCVSPINEINGGVCDETGSTGIFAETLYSIEYELPAKLVETYSTILIQAPNAEVYILGYPVVAPNKGPFDAYVFGCHGLYDGITAWGDARAAHTVLSALDATISDAVDTVSEDLQSARLHYVDVRYGSFYDHDLCSSESYFNNLDIVNHEYSLHPNYAGHVAYMEDFINYIN